MPSFKPKYINFLWWCLLPTMLHSADLALQITVNRSELEKGETATVSLKILNQDQKITRHIKVKLDLANGLVLKKAVASQGNFDGTSKLWVVEKYENMTTSVELVFDVEVKGDGPLAVRAEIIHQDENDPDSPHNNAKMGEDDLAFTFVTVPVVYCGDEKVNLTAEAFAGFTEYQWLHNGRPIPGANSRTLHVTETGRYTCQVAESRYAQVTSFPLIVKKSNAAALKVELGETKSICTGKSLSITARPTAGTPPYTYKWSNNLNKSLDTLFPAGTNLLLEVVVTDKAGCEVKDKVLVQIVDCQ